MATDREFSVILKATDLSTQPINQIVEALRKLTEAQKANNEAAAKGAITAKDFKDGLETAKSAAGGLAGAITVLQRVQDQMARTAKQGEALADMRAKLNAKQAETPPDAEPTEKQANAVKRLEASVASLQKRYEQGNATLETYIATLEKMGVAADLSDKMGTRLLREREKATQAAIVAQEKLNAKIAAAPEEGERTKAQEYSIRRLVTALEGAQSRAQQAQVALQNYQGIKLNEAIVEQQVRLREELTAVEPVIARANVETLSLTENRRKAAEAATAQANAEKLLADQMKAETAAREREEAAIAARHGKGGEIDQTIARVEAIKPLSSLNVRRAAFEAAVADQEATKKANEAQLADDAAFVARQRQINAQRIAEDEKLLAEEKRINQEKANFREFDFREAVEAQKREEVLAQQRAAAAREQQSRLEQLLESQDKIARAQAAIPGTLPSGAVPQAPRDFSQSITSILAPAQAARETLAGVEAEIEAIAASMGQAKLRSEDYDKILRQLGATFNSLTRQARLVETFREQEQALGGLLAELTKEQNTLQAMNALYARTQVYDEAQVRNILDQTNKVKGLTAAYNAQNEVFSQTKAAASAAGLELNNLAVSEQRLTEAATKAAGAMAEAQAKGSKGDIGFLGLRPYELQNLSYQINDVFTQIASGTSITQTLSQQGGQFFQLFQKQVVEAFNALKTIPFALTGVGIALSALTLIVLSFARAIDEASQKRKTLAALALDIDSVGYSVNQMEASTEKLKKFGVAAGEAGDAWRELARAGVRPDEGILGIDKILELAAKFSLATGQKFGDGFKAIKTAFLGTGKELLEFASGMSQVNLLTINQYKAVRDAIEAGDLLKARAMVMTETFEGISQAAEKNLSGIGKNIIALKAAWDSLLKSIVENTIVHAVGVDLLNFLKATVEEATKLAGILDGIMHLDVAAVIRAARGLPPLERPQTVAETSPSPTGAVKVNTEGGGLGAVGMFQLRQAAAKDVGLTPEDRYDYFKNVQGGLQYFRQQLEAFNGDLDAATRAFKEGAGGARAGKGFDYLKDVLGKDAATVDPKVMTDIREAFSGVFASYVNKADFPRIIQRIAQVALQESGAQHFLPGTEKPAGAATTPPAFKTERDLAAARQDEFRRAQEERRRVEGEAYATEQERERNLVLDLQKANREATARVAEQFKGIRIDPEALEAANLQAIAQERLKVWQDYQTAKLQRAAETQAKLDAIEQQALQGDKTNSDARLRLSDAEFERRRKALELENTRGRFPTEGGQTYQQALDLLNSSQQQAQANILIDAAKAIVENVTARREAELKEVRARLNLPGANPAEIAAAATAVVAKFAPLVVKAVDDANKALERARPLASGEQTEAVRRALAENALTRAQAARPESIGPLLQQATTGAETPVTAAVQQQAAQLAVITDSVKVAGVSAADAIGRITEFGKTSLASLRDLVATQRTQLEAIIAQPGTSDTDKARLRTLIEQNALAPSKLAVELGTALQAAIAEDKQKLDKLLAEYKAATTDLDAKIRDSRLSPLAAAAERARIDQRLIPQIGAAGRQVQQDVARGQTAAEQLGLSPGFRAGLAAEGQAAATQSNQQTLTSASVRDAAQRTLAQGKTELATMSETIRTQQELLKAGATTQTEAENATREAHEQAIKAVANLEPEIQKNIDALNEMGDNQGAKKLTADFKLLQTQVAYIDPLVQQITTGLEQSFTGRGLAAIESIAKAFGRIITGQEKFKDLLGDVGSAFANFTAGILEDVAKIIIQYTLLKAIKDALGVGPGAAAGSGAGWLANLFSSGAGVAGAAGGAAAAAGGGLTTITGSGILTSVAPLVHSGGIVGSDGMSRVVDLSVFRDAQRFHNGGMVLPRDEIPIIAQRGEKIVSLAQQRADAAQKAAQTAQSGASIRNVLAVGDKEIASAMNSSHGERVVLNVLQRNAPTVKKWVG